MPDQPERLLAEAVAAVDLDRFERFIRSRHTIRTFLPHVVDPALIDRLIDCARWAPSALNLQPTQVVVVADPDQRRALATALAQPQASEAPAIIVFVADPDAAEHHLDEMLSTESSRGTLDADAIALERARIRALFRLERPRWARRLGGGASGAPAANPLAWAERQTVVLASVFILAANSAGLGAAPMDRFDARAVRRALAIPQPYQPVLAVAIGWPFEGDHPAGRSPIDRVIHRDRWQPRD